jgi:hypothetical protein
MRLKSSIFNYQAKQATKTTEFRKCKKLNLPASDCSSTHMHTMYMHFNSPILKILLTYYLATENRKLALLRRKEIDTQSPLIFRIVIKLTNTRYPLLPTWKIVCNLTQVCLSYNLFRQCIGNKGKRILIHDNCSRWFSNY